MLRFCVIREILKRWNVENAAKEKIDEMFQKKKASLS